MGLDGERDGGGRGAPLLCGLGRGDPGGQVQVQQAVGEGAGRLRPGGWDQENTGLVGVEGGAIGSTARTHARTHTHARTQAHTHTPSPPCIPWGIQGSTLGLLLELRVLKRALSNGSQVDVLE